eukprot:m.360374 g.360374  ORF g.360374 m.360374 type:complete len:128 (+) comp20769_c0_seq8:1265-1648(+)
MCQIQNHDVPLRLQVMTWQKNRSIKLRKQVTKRCMDLHPPAVQAMRTMTRIDVPSCDKIPACCNFSWLRGISVECDFPRLTTSCLMYFFLPEPKNSADAMYDVASSKRKGGMHAVVDRSKSIKNSGV